MKKIVKKNKKTKKEITNSKQCLACKGCCIFDDKDVHLAPHLSLTELKIIEKRFLEKEKHFYKIKLTKYKKNRELMRCHFLREDDHKCLIYKKRRMECVIWPFVIGRNKSNKGVYLYAVNSDWCPAVTKEKLNDKKIIDDIVKFIKDGGFLDEILQEKRYLWPIEDYYIKIKKLI